MLIATDVWALAPDDGATSWSWSPEKGGPLAFLFPSAVRGTWLSEIVGRAGHPSSKLPEQLVANIEKVFAREHTVAQFGENGAKEPDPPVPDRPTCVEHVRAYYAKTQHTYKTVLLALTERYRKTAQLRSLGSEGDEHCRAAASLLKAARTPVPAGHRAWTAAIVRMIGGTGTGSDKAMGEAFRRGANDPFQVACDQWNEELYRPPPQTLPFWTPHFLTEVLTKSFLRAIDEPEGAPNMAIMAAEPLSRDGAVAEIKRLCEVKQSDKWLARYAIGQAAQRGERNVYSSAAQDLNKAEVLLKARKGPTYWMGNDVMMASCLSAKDLTISRPRAVQSRTDDVASIKTLYGLTGNLAGCANHAVEAARARGARKEYTMAAKDLNLAGVPPPPGAARAYWMTGDVLTVTTPVGRGAR